MLHDLTQAFFRTLGQRAEALQPLPALAGQAARPLQAPGFAETGAMAGGGLPQAEDGFTLDEILALTDSLKRQVAPRGASARGSYRRPLFRARA